MRIVVALGGNALLRRGQALTAENQRENVQIAARTLAPLAEENELVITHGNGPQVGLLALQEAAYTEVDEYPLDVLVGEELVATNVHTRQHRDWLTRIHSRGKPGRGLKIKVDFAPCHAAGVRWRQVLNVSESFCVEQCFRDELRGTTRPGPTADANCGDLGRPFIC